MPLLENFPLENSTFFFGWRQLLTSNFKKKAAPQRTSSIQAIFSLDELVPNPWFPGVFATGFLSSSNWWFQAAGNRLEHLHPKQFEGLSSLQADGTPGSSSRLKTLGETRGLGGDSLFYFCLGFSFKGLFFYPSIQHWKTSFCSSTDTGWFFFGVEKETPFFLKTIIFPHHIRELGLQSHVCHSSFIQILSRFFITMVFGP